MTRGKAPARSPAIPEGIVTAGPGESCVDDRQSKAFFRACYQTAHDGVNVSGMGLRQQQRYPSTDWVIGAVIVSVERLGSPSAVIAGNLDDPVPNS